MRSACQIRLAEDIEPHLMEGPAGLFIIIDVHGDRRTSPGMEDERIGIVDVDLGLEKCLAKLDQRMGTVGQLDGHQLVLGKRVLVQGKDLAALLGIAQDQAQNRAVRGVGDRQTDDLDLRPLKRAHDLQQLADPVLEENRELSHSRPGPAMEGFQFDFAAAVILAKAHEAPVFPGLDGVRYK